MGNQFENVKAEQMDGFVFLARPDGSMGLICYKPDDAVRNELCRRWNLFPKLVKALEKAASVMDMEGLIEAEDLQALLREAKGDGA